MDRIPPLTKVVAESTFDGLGCETTIIYDYQNIADNASFNKLTIITDGDAHQGFRVTTPSTHEIVIEFDGVFERMCLLEALESLVKKVREN